MKSSMLLAVLVGCSMCVRGQADFTAGDVLKMMKTQIGSGWFQTPTDTIVVGDATIKVKGIVTCMFVDMDILRRTVDANANVIITHEPTFYIGNDKVPEFLKSDKVYLEKLKYIRDNKLVIIRFHDNAHRLKPDQIMAGLAQEFGWKISEGRPVIADVKPQTLRALADFIKAKTGTSGIRVMGDPNLQVRKIGLVPGMAPTLEMHLGVFGRDDVDAVLVGEAREWEDYIYAKDAFVQNRKKAAIFMGHTRSEEPGMKYCADWLKTFIQQTPVQFLRNTDFWWTPK